MDKKGFKVSNLYGRARRIELVEKIAYGVVGIIAIALIFYMVSHQTSYQDGNVNFAFLREYLENKGYMCDRIHLSGGSCTFSNDIGKYVFIRRDNGFEYSISTNSYVLIMKHYLNTEDTISFRTFSDAFIGYRNKTYECSYKDNIIGGLDKCIEQDSTTELDLESYKGIINQAMDDLNKIIDSSGYDKEELIKNYVWKKK